MRRVAAFALASVLVAVLGAPDVAHAADAAASAPRASWHPKFVTDLEVHALLGVGDVYGPGGGAGVRATLPVFEGAPFRGIDDTIGLSLGLDWVRYGAYHPDGAGGDAVTADAFYIPLALPIDLWLGRVALFVEPTVAWRFTRYGVACGVVKCDTSSRVFPTGSIGLRVETVEHVAITLRAGWPMFSLGASWL